MNHNISKFIILKDYLIIYDGKSICFYNDEKKIIRKYAFEKKIYSLKVNDNYLLYDFPSGIKEIISLVTLDKAVELKEDDISILSIQNGIVSIYESKSIFEPSIKGMAKLSKSVNEIDVVWKKYLHGNFSCLTKEIMLTKDEKNIYAYHIDTGEETWSFTIADFPNYKHALKYKIVEAEIELIIGIYNDILWVLLGDIDSTLLGIDVNTGKLEHQLKSSLVLSSQVNHLDHQKGTIKTLAGNYYRELDLVTLETRKYEFSEIFLIHKSTFYEGDRYMYFCARKNTLSFPNSFGIFDTKKKEIIWHEISTENEQYFFDPPQANEKILGILDSTKALRIYKKDEIVVSSKVGL